jgi:hypothetical protein
LNQPYEIRHSCDIDCTLRAKSQAVVHDIKPLLAMAMRQPEPNPY